MGSKIYISSFAILRRECERTGAIIQYFGRSIRILVFPLNDDEYYILRGLSRHLKLSHFCFILKAMFSKSLLPLVFPCGL